MADVNRRLPLDEAGQQALAAWWLDPNRKAPERQARPNVIPQGWTKEAWNAASPNVRKAVRVEADKLHAMQTLNKLLNDPKTAPAPQSAALPAPGFSVG
jgi:hypothetical protein